MFLQALRMSIKARASSSGLAFTIPFGASRHYGGRRVCLFSHFDTEARLDDHVVHYMRALAAAELDVVLISSCATLDKASMAAARDICSTIIFRANRGFDFAGWALALNELPGILQADEIVFANDSVYGPLRPLGPIFDAMNRRGHPIWGLTQNLEIRWHVQSFFLVFKKEAIASAAFRSFWFNVEPLEDKWEIVKRYETQLAGFFEQRGFRVDHYVNSIRGENLRDNPTQKHWKLAIEGGLPFLKVQLLRDNPLHADITGWDVVAAAGGYDVDLIRRHLLRVRGSLPVSPRQEPKFHVAREPGSRVRKGAVWVGRQTA